MAVKKIVGKTIATDGQRWNFAKTGTQAREKAGAPKRKLFPGTKNRPKLCKPFHYVHLWPLVHRTRVGRSMCLSMNSYTCKHVGVYESFILATIDGQTDHLLSG